IIGFPPSRSALFPLHCFSQSSRTMAGSRFSTLQPFFIYSKKPALSTQEQVLSWFIQGVDANGSLPMGSPVSGR
ncbi:hypothetical protein, partial [uncultured Acidaminococcus sp.]|uniref:hypothetical protein n=1 Tax=uncultured Acidaminococcus sp. TaxID=352152 RepID=UPI00258C5899